MGKRGLCFLVLVVFLSLGFSGCYYFSAKSEIKTAEMKYQELKGAGGADKVPYEYCSAEKFLEISRKEFDENDFKTAKGYATRSKSASEAGLAKVK